MFLTIAYIVIFLASLVALFAALTGILLLLKKPSNNRNWEFGQQEIQKIDIKDDKITINKLRDYNWNQKKVTAKYMNRSFKLSDITGIEIGQSHFSKSNLVAHIFIIFNLKNGKDIGLSIEARRNDGEKYTLFKGLIFDYELGYIWATKKDLISLRKKRKERIYLFPVKTRSKTPANLFKRLAKRNNKLYEKPELYHLIFWNCTNQITREVAKIANRRIPYLEPSFAPGHAGKLLFKMGLIKGLKVKKGFRKIIEDYRVKF